MLIEVGDEKIILFRFPTSISAPVNRLMVKFSTNCMKFRTNGKMALCPFRKPGLKKLLLKASWKVFRLENCCLFRLGKTILQKTPAYSDFENLWLKKLLHIASKIF